MLSRFLLLVTLAALPFLGAQANDSWPGYRGPTADGRSDAKTLATTWSETDNVRWKTAIHGRGWSSPVILGKQVWVTTSEEVPSEANPAPKKGSPPPNVLKEVSLFAVCVDRDTGKVVHDIKLRTESSPAYCHPFNTYASPTPFLEDGRLYAHFGSHGTWCVDTATGKVLWERTDLKCDHFRGPASSPVVYGDRVYLIFDGFDLQYVAALDKTTGKTAWKADRKIRYSSDNGDIKKAYSTPTMIEANGRQLLVCPSAECTIAYDPKTGAELWRLAHGGMNVATRPVAGSGVMYLTTGNPERLLAVKIDAKTDDTGMLPKDALVWTVNKNVPSRPSPLLDNGLLYLVSDKGIASCVEAASGQVVWSERLDGEFSASPVFANGHVYFCNQIGKTFVVPAGKKFNVLAENRLGEGKDAGIMGSPAIAGNTLFLRSKTHLYAIATK